MICSSCGAGFSRGRGRPPRTPLCADCSFATATIDPDLRFGEDPAAQRFVDLHPGGASLLEVAEALGLTLRNVQYIEEVAVQHMRKRLRLVGVDADSLAALDCKPEHPLAGTWADEDVA